MLSSVARAAGRAVLTPSSPAIWLSQSMGAPSASSAASVASTISGPMPSPGISVAGMAGRGLPAAGVTRGLYLALLMILDCVNSSSPSWPISVPKPDCLAPPNGMSGGRSRCLLTQTVPESIRCATS